MDKTSVLVCLLMSIGQATTKATQPSKYEISEDRLTWTEARDYCSARERHLVTIESAMEQNFLHLVAQTNAGKQFFWIGLNDINNTGIYTWTHNGAEPTFSNWDPSPDRCFNNPPCCGYYSSWPEGPWYQAECLNNFRFICEW